jgi:predicted transcriptional regulator
MSKSGVAIESKLALTDIVNPMETEAESHILRALEEQSRVTKPSSTSAVLPDLTDEAAESLESQIENSKSSSNSDLKLEDSLSVISGGSKKGSRKKKPRHRRTNTVASQLTIGSGEPNHMDATLFELSTVMRNIHNNANEEHAEDLEPMRGHHRVASQDIGHPIATSISDHPITGSDALANNAALLFRGKMKQAELVVVESSSNETDPKKNDDLIAEGSNESSDEQGSEHSHDVELGRPHSSAGESRRRHGRSIAEKMLDAAKADWDYLSEFLGHRRRGMYVYFRTLLFFLIIPALAISGLLFYFFGNPLMRGAGGASISWFLIFLLIRHSICFSIGKVSEIVLIDFFALKTGLILRMFGSVFTLLVINSKGWPSLISWWGFYGLCLLSGDSGKSRASKVVLV